MHILLSFDKMFFLIMYVICNTFGLFKNVQVAHDCKHKKLITIEIAITSIIVKSFQPHCNLQVSRQNASSFCT